MAKNSKTKESRYVDGFVFVVPRNKIKEYKKMAEMAGKVWKKYGALDYKECIGDDLKPKAMGEMKPLSFLDISRTGSKETVWFSFIVYKSKKHRDEVNAKVMKDPLMDDPSWKDKPMPFDMTRMAYGGFRVEIDF